MVLILLSSKRAIPKEDFYHMLSKFHQRGRLSKEINATFMYLIAKIQNPVGFKDLAIKDIG